MTRSRTNKQRHEHQTTSKLDLDTIKAKRKGRSFQACANEKEVTVCSHDEHCTFTCNETRKQSSKGFEGRFGRCLLIGPGLGIGPRHCFLRRNPGWRPCDDTNPFRQGKKLKSRTKWKKRRKKSNRQVRPTEKIIMAKHGRIMLRLPFLNDLCDTGCTCHFQAGVHFLDALSNSKDTLYVARVTIE